LMKDNSVYNDLNPQVEYLENRFLDNFY
jgi:hypothetical protein